MKNRQKGVVFFTKKSSEPEGKNAGAASEVAGVESEVVDPKSGKFHVLETMFDDEQRAAIEAIDDLVFIKMDTRKLTALSLLDAGHIKALGRSLEKMSGDQIVAVSQLSLDVIGKLGNRIIKLTSVQLMRASLSLDSFSLYFDTVRNKFIDSRGSEEYTHTGFNEFVEAVGLANVFQMSDEQMKEVVKLDIRTIRKLGGRSWWNVEAGTTYSGYHGDALVDMTPEQISKLR